MGRSIFVLVATAGVILLGSCKKQGVFAPVDFNRISALLEDNFNLSIFKTAVQRTGMKEVLQNESGPYTVFVPSDYAFSKYGIANRTQLLSQSYAWIDRMVKYHVVPGKYQLSKLPFQFNQELSSQWGKLFVTHWMKGKDTVYTVNGAIVSLQDVPASNGRLQIISKVLEPYAYSRISDAIRGDTITLFSEALRRSGLLDTLALNGPFTVFAPSNSAMRAYGYDSIEKVRNASVDTLRSLCSYHICIGLHFISDYILTTTGATSAERMLNGYSLTVKPVASVGAPWGYSGIRVAGPGNTAYVNITRSDIITGNGVLHIVDNVLRLTR